MMVSAVSRLSRFKPWLERLGLVFALGLGVWFAVSLAATDWGALSGISPSRLGVTIGMAAFGYGALSLVLVLAWRTFIAATGHAPEGHSRVYALTQLMKYLPGNVVHVAGRHAMAARLGVSHRILVALGGAELILVLLAGTVVAFLSGPAFLRVLSGLGLSPSLALAAAALSLAVALVLVSVGRRFVAATLRSANLEPSAAVTASITAFGLYTAFFLGCGFVGYWLLSFGLGTPPPSPLFLSGALALAWCAGFVTPGAPAGLGVREVVLLMLLDPIIGAPTALAFAALYRASTVAGDLLVAGAAFAGTARPHFETSAEANP